MPYTVRDAMRRAVTALASVLLLCSCSGGACRETITTDEFETDYSTVYAEVISFEGMESREYESELNLAIESDVAAAVNEFDTLATEASEKLPAGIKSAFKVTQEVKKNKDGFLSFVESHYIYTGGAHGSTSWYPRNIDLCSDEPHPLALKELFDDDGYRETINRLIDELIEKDPQKYSGLWEEPHINAENENNYYITDEELVIFFPPYTLSYYAKGFVEFPIRLGEVEGMLKEEYRRLVPHCESG